MLDCLHHKERQSARLPQPATTSRQPTLLPVRSMIKSLCQVKSSLNVYVRYLQREPATVPGLHSISGAAGPVVHSHFNPSDYCPARHHCRPWWWQHLIGDLTKAAAAAPVAGSCKF